MPVEVVTEDSRWDDLGLEDLAEKVSVEALTYLGLDPDICEVTLLACDDARIAVLNADFRDKGQPTNVLSWPNAELAPECEGEKPDMPEPDIMGELALGQNIAFNGKRVVRVSKLEFYWIANKVKRFSESIF